jgi:hypothetical protein
VQSILFLNQFPEFKKMASALKGEPPLNNLRLINLPGKDNYFTNYPNLRAP